LSRAQAFATAFPRPRPLIGVVHLPPLPGYAGYPGMAALVRHALADLEVLERAGYDGVLIENEHDQPHRVLAAPETLAAITEVTAKAVAAAQRVVVGVEILLNDPKASLAAAQASGARFIRTDYFVDRMARDEYGGEMAIDPEGLLAYRRAIGADSVLILADVQVKYARMLTPRPLAESAREASAKRADAVIVTGTLTGVPPSVKELDDATAGADGCPVLIGSGLTAANAGEILTRSGGAVVGTGIMRSGKIDLELAQELARARARDLDRRAGS
jgi:membrane complex biogenesis BtpA family protein